MLLSCQPPPKPKSQWSSEETQLVIQGFCQLGRDFKAIADVIGTKNAVQVRSFYTQQKGRYNLDDVIRKCEMERGIQRVSPVNVAQHEPVSRLATLIFVMCRG